MLFKRDLFDEEDDPVNRLHGPDLLSRRRPPLDSTSIQGAEIRFRPYHWLCVDEADGVCRNPIMQSATIAGKWHLVWVVACRWCRSEKGWDPKLHPLMPCDENARYIL